MGSNRRASGEGGIHLRKDGRYEGRYTVHTINGSKRKSVFGKSRSDVAAKLAKVVSLRNAGFVFDGGNIALSDYMSQWLRDSVEGSVKRRTFEWYSANCRKHIAPVLGKVKLSALTPGHIQNLYRIKLDEGLSPTSVQHIHTTLHRALKQAVKWELIHRNVCEAVSVPKRNSPEIVPLTPEQSRQFLIAAKGDPHECLYVLALTTGMRQGELLGLAWRDVNLADGILFVRRSLVTGWGRQTYETPKTAKSRRSIKLSQLATSALIEHRSKQQNAGLYAEDGPVFTNRDGRPLHPKNLVDRHFRPLLRRAGLPQIRFHDLRHSAATLLLSKGIHPKIVSEVLGHANISITLDVYSHCLPNMQGPAASAMDDALG